MSVLGGVLSAVAVASGVLGFGLWKFYHRRRRGEGGYLMPQNDPRAIAARVQAERERSGTS